MARPPEMYDLPLSRKQVADRYEHLSKLSLEKVIEEYRRAHELCRMDTGISPKAQAIQELVTAWRVIWQRRRQGMIRR